ncbi:MAG: putative lipid II flippase FtsW [Thermoleophilia bacterium]|nr:putative lipid II flippase FtsW [Thermoleophilia bacterium]
MPSRSRTLRPVPAPEERPAPRTRTRHGHGPETLLIAVVTALVCFGTVMVYSSSSSRAFLEDGDPLRFVKRQVIFAIVGVGAYLLCTRIDIRILTRIAGPFMGVTVVLLLAVLLPGVGQEINGSKRWLPMPVIGQLQPSELAKFALVLWIAAAVARDPKRLGTLRGMVPYLAVTGLLSVLILAEPDLGTASTLFLVALAVLLVGGAQHKHVGAVFGGAIALSALAIAAAPYRRERLLAFLDPMSDPDGIGFQTLQAQIALGSGGLTGKGLGDGVQKAFYLPEAHTDMILATIGEELGVVGVLLVLAAIGLIAMLAYRIALDCADLHRRLVATGIATLIAIQGLDNIAAVLGAFPITGVPLPFVSYGGSSLIVLLASIGILVNIARSGNRHAARQHSTQAGARGDRGRGDGRPRDAGAGGGRSAARAGR